MAEYVRRKRPPVDHPYWTHLDDRAHPPSVVWPVVVPAVVGLGVGLAAGLNDPYPVAEAVRTAAGLAATFAGLLASASFIPFLFNIVRRPKDWEAYMQALVVSVCIGLCGLVVTFVPVALFLFWYSVSGGHGLWIGIMIGTGIGILPGAGLAWFNRLRWAERRRRWPRWETMRRRHRRRVATPAPAAVPAPPAADADPSKAAG